MKRFYLDSGQVSCHSLDTFNLRPLSRYKDYRESIKKDISSHFFPVRLSESVSVIQSFMESDTDPFDYGWVSSSDFVSKEMERVEKLTN